MTEPYDCENCGRYVRITEGRTEKDRICIFDGECEHLPMTNEEWLHTLNTEQLAEWIHTAIFDDNFANKIADEAYMNMQTRGDYIEMWLKQPHTESSSNP